MLTLRLTDAAMKDEPFYWSIERRRQERQRRSVQPVVRRRERIIQRVILLLYAIAMGTIGYHSLAFGVWQFRNPKANAMTFYSHYWDVMTWKKLPEFQ